jgi:hypothetical protein
VSKIPLLLGYFCIVIAASALSSAFAIAEFFLGIGVTVLVSVTWGVFIWRKWIFGSILCLLIFVLGISLAVIFKGSRLILLISLLATLSAWDLAAFHLRLSASKHVTKKDQLIRTHLLRLSSVLVIGLALPLLTFGLQFDLKFWQVFLLGILLLMGLSQIFVQLKRGSNN